MGNSVNSSNLPPYFPSQYPQEPQNVLELEHDNSSRYSKTTFFKYDGQTQKNLVEVANQSPSGSLKQYMNSKDYKNRIISFELAEFVNILNNNRNPDQQPIFDFRKLRQEDVNKITVDEVIFNRISGLSQEELSQVYYDIYDPSKKRVEIWKYVRNGRKSIEKDLAEEINASVSRMNPKRGVIFDVGRIFQLALTELHASKKRLRDEDESVNQHKAKKSRISVDQRVHKLNAFYNNNLREVNSSVYNNNQNSSYFVTQPAMNSSFENPPHDGMNGQVRQVPYEANNVPYNAPTQYYPQQEGMYGQFGEALFGVNSLHYNNAPVQQSMIAPPFHENSTLTAIDQQTKEKPVGLSNYAQHPLAEHTAETHLGKPICALTFVQIQDKMRDEYNILDFEIRKKISSVLKDREIGNRINNTRNFSVRDAMTINAITGKKFFNFDPNSLKHIAVIPDHLNLFNQLINEENEPKKIKLLRYFGIYTQYSKSNGRLEKIDPKDAEVINDYYKRTKKIPMVFDVNAVFKEAIREATVYAKQYVSSKKNGAPSNASVEESMNGQFGQALYGANAPAQYHPPHEGTYGQFTGAPLGVNSLHYNNSQTLASAYYSNNAAQQSLNWSYGYVPYDGLSYNNSRTSTYYNNAPNQSAINGQGQVPYGAYNQSYNNSQIPSYFVPQPVMNNTSEMNNSAYNDNPTPHHFDPSTNQVENESVNGNDEGSIASSSTTPEKAPNEDESPFLSPLPENFIYDGLTLEDLIGMPPWESTQRTESSSPQSVIPPVSLEVEPKPAEAESENGEWNMLNYDPNHPASSRNPNSDDYGDLDLFNISAL